MEQAVNGTSPLAGPLRETPVGPHSRLREFLKVTEHDSPSLMGRSIGGRNTAVNVLLSMKHVPGKVRSAGERESESPRKHAQR